MPPKKSGKSKATARTARQETAETPRQPARRQETAEGSGSYDRFNLILPLELADLPGCNIQAQIYTTQPPPPHQASTIRSPPPRQAPTIQLGSQLNYYYLVKHLQLN